MAFKVLLVLGALSFVTCSNVEVRSSEAIDSSFLENVLDVEECDRQIEAIRSSRLHLLEFMDAGLRIPRGIFTGNLVDLGNYHQCLAMKQEIEGMHVEGKYCSILIPFEQDDITLPQDRGIQFSPSSLRLDNETISKIEEYNLGRRGILAMSGKFDDFQHERSINPDIPEELLVFRLGVCVPKPCTAKQAMDSIFNVTDEFGLRYHEDYCRLPGDKTWVAADYTAVCIFGALGLLNLLSTCYDLCHRFVLKKDLNQISTLGRSFSVYTNGIRLTTFSNGGGNLRCLDGIRTLAILWVIIAHSYSLESFIANPFDSQEWMFSANALWITASTMTVDTFFTITGILLVYTTAGKIKSKTFLKNIHWFYLNRYIRLTPLLAVAVLLQASFFNRMTDGPYWQSVVYATETCRTNWWTTLLHVQNLVNVDDMCIAHSWYVAIDFQLHVISPLVILWVLSGKKRYAWIGVVGGLAAVLAGSTIYSFIINVPAGHLVPSRYQEMADYFRLYYFFTLTRASPFFVGLLFGYILHLYRNEKLYLPWPIAILFWANALGVLGGIFYFKFMIKQFDWNNELIDNLMNSFMRPAYACTICWIVTACVHGYGGPLDWFLSHRAWRLPARLTYGMYLFHYPLMISLNGAAVSPTFFSVEAFAFKFVAHTVLAVVCSFIFTLLVDSPITALFKQLLNSGEKTTPIIVIDEATEEDVEVNNDSTEGIQRNMATIEVDDDDIVDSDDVSSESDDDVSQSSSNDVNSETNDIASEASSNVVNFESSTSNPNEVKSHSSDSIVEPGASRSDSSNKIVEPNASSIKSSDKIVEPNNLSDTNLEANTASISDKIVEPSASRSEPRHNIFEPNAANINSSSSLPESSTSRVNSSDKIDETSTTGIGSSSNDNNMVASNTNVTSDTVPDTATNAE